MTWRARIGLLCLVALAALSCGSGDEREHFGRVRFETEHFRYYALDGAAPCENTGYWLERIYSAISDYLEVPNSRSDKIDYEWVGLDHTDLTIQACRSQAAACAEGDQRITSTRAFDAHAQTAAAANGTGAFSAADVALLEDIADTILPETSTPGARAARTGAFMALMVTDVYTAPHQQAFMNGLRELNEACRRAHGVSFSEASGAMRQALLETLDRERQAEMEARSAARVARAPAPIPATAEDEAPVHYFRMMKELALLGYFTSEIGCTQALRYVETPGRFDPCVEYRPGDRAWAGHA